METQIRASVCPICGCHIEPKTLGFGRTFRCPCCHERLVLAAAYELVVRAIAVLIGFGIVYQLGFRDVMLFCLGFVPAPFLILPIANVVKSIWPPRIALASENLSTLDLRDK